MLAMTEERLRDTVLRGLSGERFDEGFCPCSNLFLPTGTWRVKAKDGRMSIEAGAVTFSVSENGVRARTPEGYLRGEECYNRIRGIIKSVLSDWLKEP